MMQPNIFQLAEFSKKGLKVGQKYRDVKALVLARENMGNPLTIWNGCGSSAGKATLQVHTLFPYYHDRCDDLYSTQS
jgi:hypothetical protein